VADELTNIYEINEMIDKLISNATFYKIDESKLPLEDAIIDIKNTLTRRLSTCDPRVVEQDVFGHIQEVDVGISYCSLLSRPSGRIPRSS
jgi:hypothetical protein